MKTSKIERAAFGNQPDLTPFYLQPNLQGAAKCVAFMNRTIPTAFTVKTKQKEGN